MKKADAVRILSEIFQGFAVEQLDTMGEVQQWALVTLAGPVGKSMDDARELEIVRQWLTIGEGRPFANFVVSALLDIENCEKCPASNPVDPTVLIPYCEPHYREVFKVPETITIRGMLLRGDDPEAPKNLSRPKDEYPLLVDFTPRALGIIRVFMQGDDLWGEAELRLDAGASPVLLGELQYFSVGIMVEGIQLRHPSRSQEVLEAKLLSVSIVKENSDPDLPPFEVIR